MTINYQEQTWVDGSSGGTPINASRLGHMEDGIKAACDDCDSDKWRSGDTMSVTGLNTAGYITSSKTSLRFTIPLNRQIEDGVTASVSGSWTIAARGENGYEIGSSSGGATVSADSISLTIRSGWINATITGSYTLNNTAIGVSIQSGSIKLT